MRAVAACLLLAACGFTASTGGGGATGDGRAIDTPTGGGSDAPTSTGVDAALIDAAMIDAPPDAPGCGSGFNLIVNAGTSQYRIFDKASQTTALITCAGQNSHLLHLDTQAEATAVEDAINAEFGGGDTGQYRIVGSRDSIFRNNWHDITFIQLLSFLPWANAEPTDGLGKDCLLLQKQGNEGKIVAEQCGTQHEFACECD